MYFGIFLYVLHGLCLINLIGAMPLGKHLYCIVYLFLRKSQQGPWIMYKKNIKNNKPLKTFVAETIMSN